MMAGARSQSFTIAALAPSATADLPSQRRAYCPGLRGSGALNQPQRSPQHILLCQRKDVNCLP
jgi:hypothetical protein